MYIEKALEYWLGKREGFMGSSMQNKIFWAEERRKME